MSVLNGIIDEIRSAYAEIASVWAIIDALQIFPVIIPLANQYYTGEISVEWYTIQLIWFLFIAPLIPSLIIGWISNKLGILKWVRKFM